MRVHRYASASNYADHLDPIWAALPAEVRGYSWAPRPSPWGQPRNGREWQEPGPVMVASYADARSMAGRALIHVEHGAGHTWPACPDLAGHPGYSDGGDMGRVILFVVPGEPVAERRRKRYPRTPVAVVGCPRLDRYAERQQVIADVGSAPNTNGTDPTVAITWHWHHRRCPELRSALPHYQEALGPLCERLSVAGIAVLGHAHPKAERVVEPIWRSLGVPYTPDLGEVYDRADLLVVDVSSVAYEFAALGRPVLNLNAPWYRRGVEQGLRFWSHVPGLQCDEPDDLYESILRALADPPEAQALRQKAVSHVYAALDGHAAERAAAAILEVL